MFQTVGVVWRRSQGHPVPAWGQPCPHQDPKLPPGTCSGIAITWWQRIRHNFKIVAGNEVTARCPSPPEGGSLGPLPRSPLRDRHRRHLRPPPLAHLARKTRQFARTCGTDLPPVSLITLAATNIREASWSAAVLRRFSLSSVHFILITDYPLPAWPSDPVFSSLPAFLIKKSLFRSPSFPCLPSVKTLLFPCILPKGGFSPSPPFRGGEGPLPKSPDCGSVTRSASTCQWSRDCLRWIIPNPCKSCAP